MAHIEFFLKKSIFTFVLMGLLIFAGVHYLTKLNVETLPEVSTPVIYVAVPLPGGAPEDVEAQVTIPLEQKLSELEDVDRVLSSSWQNVSIVVVFFKDNVKSRDKVAEFREKVNEALPSLPAEIMPPRIEEISFENLPMMFVGFSGGGKSQYELSRYAARIKKQLEVVPGVKKVTLLGAVDKRVMVEMEPEGLKKYGPAPLKFLFEKLAMMNTNMPGGKVSVMGKEYTVRTIGKFTDMRDLRDMVVATGPAGNARLGDVADVREEYPEPETIVHVDGARGVSLGVMKKRGYGTLGVADGVKKVLKKYPDVAVMSDASAFIRHQMGELRNHAIWGACLVMAILLLSLGFRTAAIVTFSLPMSFFMTFIAMSFCGMTMNTVTLFSLLLALGMMVDNSIVVCENIFRHRSMGKSAFEASLAGATEVTWPIFSSTAAVAAAFLPMAVFLVGPIGEFTRPIPIVVTFALVASLIIANFLNPLLCMTFIKNVREGGEEGTDTFIGRAKISYKKIMDWCLGHAGVVMSAAVALLAVCIMLVVFKVIGLQLFPQLDTAKFYIDVRTPQGSNMEETTRAVARIEKVFNESKYVNHYITNIGSSGTRLEIDDKVDFGSNIARFIVDLKPRGEIDRSHKQVVQGFREQFQKMFTDGTKVSFIEKALGPPMGAPINIKVTGQDYEAMGKVTAAIRELLKSEPGVIDLDDDLPAAVPQIALRANPDAMGRMGMTTRDLGGFIFLALTGYSVGDISLDGEKRDVFLKIKQGKGMDVTALQSASFTLPDGSLMRFSDLLSYETTTGLSGIERDQGKRTVTIEAGVAKGFEAKRIVDKLKTRIKNKHRLIAQDDPSLGKVSVEFAGEGMLLGKAMENLTTAMLASLLLIYIILLIEFRSTLQPLIILVCVPYALVGVILGLLIMGYSFSVLAGIGLLCLIGIVVNNGIIYIDYANLLQERGMALREACLEACATRLRPIVLTKITVILGIMPMAMANASKAQFWKPLCWAIIWGLVIATTLTLVIIPVAYHTAEGWRKKYYEKRKA